MQTEFLSRDQLQLVLVVFFSFNMTNTSQFPTVYAQYVFHMIITIVTDYFSKHF
jgi:hypothetical protein